MPTALVSDYIIAKTIEWTRIIEAKEASKELEADERLKEPNYILLSGQQRFFFLLTKVFGYTGCCRGIDANSYEQGHEKELEAEKYHEWKRLLHMTPFSFSNQEEVDKVIRVAETYHVISLHPLKEAVNPKLILACGNGGTKKAKSHPHYHHDADTMDRLLDLNPTWVAEFGAISNDQNALHPNIRYFIEHYRNHYQFIVDEGLTAEEYSNEMWIELSRLLKPGGFFFANPMKLNKKPSIPSEFKLHHISFNGDDRKYRVITKEFEQEEKKEKEERQSEKHPTYIRLGDIPEEIRASFIDPSIEVPLSSPYLVSLD